MLFQSNNPLNNEIGSFSKFSNKSDNMNRFSNTHDIKLWKFDKSKNRYKFRNEKGKGI